MKIFRYLAHIYWRYFKTAEQYAKHIGVNIGKNNLIGYNHWSTEPYLISIGNNCQLTDCKIYTHGGANMIRETYPDFDMFGKVVICDFVYIGSGSKIMPGVTIEDHVLVAAGSIVTKSVPSGSIVAGNPARIIGKIDDYMERNLKYNTHTRGVGRQKRKKILLSLEEEAFIRKPFMKLNK